jgi:23S rRNA (uridine2552-2'-O)-methyltransferase
VYQRKDSFYRRAKTAGYRSRAAFKLQQLAKTTRLFRPGDRVVDLGAWPGGWLQVASEAVGPAGRVVGVDLRKVEPLAQSNIVIIVGDIGSSTIQDQVILACDGPADVVLSDLAPKLTGVRDRDDAQSELLADCVLQFAKRVLRTGGKIVIKLFMSAALPRYIAELRSLFAHVRTSRPEATRKGSAEIYVVATGFRGIAAV